VTDTTQISETKSGSGPENTGFFDSEREPKEEIVEGLFREGQIVAFSGPYGMGKTPALMDLSIRLIYGLDWCGRGVLRRPVIHYDLESSEAAYVSAMRNICKRLGVPYPRIQEQLIVRLFQGDIKDSLTSELHKAVETGSKACFELMERDLKEKSGALVICDPAELFLSIDTNKKLNILKHVRCYRELLSEFPRAASLNTFNMRKPDRKQGAVDGKTLLANPRRWLEEVAGSNDLMNRSDVRLGIDRYEDDVRILNGIRRGEEMNPLFIRPIGSTPEDLSGFELYRPSGLELSAAFTKGQLEYWQRLPEEFRFDDVVDDIVPKSSLSRLAKRAKELGILEVVNGKWRKLVSR
jgi:hypothetical protein